MRIIIISEVKNGVSILHLRENGKTIKSGVRQIKGAIPNYILAKNEECDEYEFIETDSSKLCYVIKKRNMDSTTLNALLINESQANLN